MLAQNNLDKMYFKVKRIFSSMNSRSTDITQKHNRVIIKICSLLGRVIYELKTHTSTKGKSE